MNATRKAMEKTNNKLDERQARGTDAGHHSTKLMQFNQIKSTHRL